MDVGGTWMCMYIGGVQTYEGHTNVGDICTYEGVWTWGAYGYMGVVQMYGGAQWNTDV